jgi:hypothetical protein
MIAGEFKEFIVIVSYMVVEGISVQRPAIIGPSAVPREVAATYKTETRVRRRREV